MAGLTARWSSLTLDLGLDDVDERVDGEAGSLGSFIAYLRALEYGEQILQTSERRTDTVA